MRLPIRGATVKKIVLDLVKRNLFNYFLLIFTGALVKKIALHRFKSRGAARGGGRTLRGGEDADRRERGRGPGGWFAACTARDGGPPPCGIQSLIEPQNRRTVQVLQSGSNAEHSCFRLACWFRRVGFSSRNNTIIMKGPRPCRRDENDENSKCCWK